MLTTDETLEGMIDRTLFELESPSERGRPVVMGATFLTDDTDNQILLSSGSANVSDILEFGSELLFVTAKSSDVDPLYTVARGYYNTTKAAHPQDSIGHTNPQFPRRRIADAIDRSFARIEALGVPLIQVTEGYRIEGTRLIDIPADARQVLQVLYVNPTSGRILEIDNWFAYHNIVNDTTNKSLMLPWYVDDEDELQIVYSTGYTWTGTFPDESATMTMPVAAASLPSTYAAAMMITGREVSRQEIDRAQEFASTVPLGSGGGSALVRLKWQEFYRALDEARRATQFEIPTARPLTKRPRVRI